MEITILPADHKTLSPFFEREFGAHAQEEIGAQREYFAFQIVEEGEVIAAIHGYSFGGDVYIREMVVIKARRGEGLGRALVEHVKTIVKAEGKTTLWVDTLGYQAPEFYERQGFAEYARVPRYRGAHDRVFYRVAL